jgi:hypothetical protein
MRFVSVIITILVLAACTKARKCECYDSVYDKKETIYINGNKKDAQKVCVNIADTNEVCTLIDQ